jgi:hypothetical protein
MNWFPIAGWIILSAVGLIFVSDGVAWLRHRECGPQPPADDHLQPQFEPAKNKQAA